MQFTTNETSGKIILQITEVQADIRQLEFFLTEQGQHKNRNKDSVLRRPRQNRSSPRTGDCSYPATRLYQQTKYDAEPLVNNFCKKKGMDTDILRSAAIYTTREIRSGLR